jgi:hypothetical protein
VSTETLPRGAEAPLRITVQLAEMRAILDQILATLTAPPPETRTSYTVEEVARALGKSAYTVREWCREGRVSATKRSERRGGAELWAISADELTRIKNEGLLAPDPHRNAGR